jgi:hypothetical protein
VLTISCEQSQSCVGSEVLIAMVTKSYIFWDITPCSPLKINQRFGGKYRLHLLWRWYLARLIRPWRWRRYIPPKRRLTFNGLQCVIFHKIVLCRVHPDDEDETEPNKSDRWDTRNWLNVKLTSYVIFWSSRWMQEECQKIIPSSCDPLWAAVLLIGHCKYRVIHLKC